MKVVDGLYTKADGSLFGDNNDYYLERINNKWRKSYLDGQKDSFYAEYIGLMCDSHAKSGAWKLHTSYKCNAEISMSPDKSIFYIIPDGTPNHLLKPYEKLLEDAISHERVTLKFHSLGLLILGRSALADTII